MGLDNPVHLLILAVIALVVLGPKRLPEAGRALGKGLREFKDSVSGAGDPPPRAEVEPAARPAPEDPTVAAETGPGPGPGQDAAPAASSGEPPAAPHEPADPA